MVRITMILLYFYTVNQLFRPTGIHLYIVLSRDRFYWNCLNSLSPKMKRKRVSFQSISRSNHSLISLVTSTCYIIDYWQFLGAPSEECFRKPLEWRCTVFQDHVSAFKGNLVTANTVWSFPFFLLNISAAENFRERNLLLRIYQLLSPSRIFFLF